MTGSSCICFLESSLLVNKSIFKENLSVSGLILINKYHIMLGIVYFEKYFLNLDFSESIEQCNNFSNILVSIIGEKWFVSIYN